MTRIGFLGAYSIDNAGDAIVGYASRQAIRARLPNAEQIVYAPALPDALWKHAWDRERGIDAEIVQVPANDTLDWAADLDALVIGGGGIISLDPAFRPFLLGRADRYTGAAAWNAVCSQNQPWYAGGHVETYDAVAACCEKLRYVAVRNKTSLAFVRRCGFAGDVHLVPDPAIALALPPDVGPRVDEIMRDLGIRDGLRIGISLGPTLHDARTAAFYRELFAALAIVQRDLDAQLVVFPWSHIQGDDSVAEIVAKQLPGALVVRRRLAALELWALVGRMTAYIGVRYHAMLAAFAQNVPFLVVDEYLSDAVASSKTRELVADVGLEPHYLCPWLPQSPAWKVENIIRSHAQVSFTNRLVELRARIDAHYTRMLTALGFTLPA